MPSPQIHVARPPTQLGVFSQEEIAQGLGTGRFLPTDQGWREGMSAWAPLGQWAEFVGVGTGAGVPDSPVGGGGASVNAPSQVPWEQGKSAGSFFATLKGAILTPHATLSSARLEVGDWLIFAYFAQLLVLPLRLIEVLVFEDPNLQVAKFIEGLNNPAWASLAEQLRQGAAVGAAQQGFKVLGLLLGLGVGPLVIAVLGVVLWCCAWVCRLKVEIGRTVAATLLAYSVTALATAPFGLLGFSILLLGASACLFSIPAMMVYCRAQGAALQRSAWAMFGVNLLAFFLFVCCIACAIAGLAFAFRSLR